MNRYHPYCPPLPQIPADIILVDTCDMRRFVNPLTGILHPLGNVLGYRYVSPDGDGLPVTYSVTHSHTDHSSLITDHSSHTFSAKEKDAETGLSYFGARYYSSDLSIWLSVDPMSDKYPSLSPYVYCANNPVKLVDPNGEEVGDFFDENGIFLGSDGKDDGKIYIISQDIWDRYVECDENDNLTGVLADPEYRDLYTKKPSQAYLSNEAVFSILSFYNSTGFELTRNDNLGSGVLLRTRVEGHTGMNDYTVLELANPKEWITISQNHPDTYLDNYFDIKSAYDNERGHIKQFLSIGGDAYSAQTDSQRENYALDHQQSQPMYKKTSNYFKDQTENYKLQNR